MALPEPLLSMCRHTVTVESPASVSKYGVVTYSTDSSSYAARIVGKRRVVRNEEGNEVVSNHTIYVADDVQIDPRSRITLSVVPSGCSSQPQILSTHYYPDDTEDGLSHAVIYV